MIEIGNLLYFIVILFCVLLFLGLYFFLRNKDKEFIFKFVLALSIINFSLHFIKQLFYWDYNQLHKSTLENICAVSTVLFPFIIYFSKKKSSVITDFMYFVGFMGGFLALVDPTEAIGHELIRFESIRFYFCHFCLITIPLLLAIFDIYRPRLNKWYYIPLMFMVYETIIFINTFVVCYTGLVTREGYTAFELFIDRNYVNNSLVFGPTDDLGFMTTVLSKLTPFFLKIDYFNITGGDFYFPIIWLLVPMYIFTPIYLLITLPFYKKNKSHA